MRTGFLGLISIGLLSSLGCEKTYTPLTQYTSKEGNFQCLFPGEPRWRTTMFSIAPIHFAEAENPGIEYAAAYGDFMGGSPTARDLPRIYAAMKEGVMKEYNATLTYETSALVDGRPGFEFGLKMPGKQESVCKMRGAAIGGRLYMFGVSGARAEVNSKDARQFLESFRVLGATATAKK
jgi:hypothetical protein